MHLMMFFLNLIKIHRIFCVVSMGSPSLLLCSNYLLPVFLRVERLHSFLCCIAMCFTNRHNVSNVSVRASGSIKVNVQYRQGHTVIKLRFIIDRRLWVGRTMSVDLKCAQYSLSFVFILTRTSKKKKKIILNHIYVFWRCLYL